MPWVDGVADAPVGLQDRGLAYGDGLFETYRVSRGRLTLAEYHWQRLERGCQVLGLTLPTPLAGELEQVAAGLGEGVLKLILTRGDAVRGYATAPDARSRRIVLTSAVPQYPPAHAEAGIALFECQTRLARQPLLAGLKHLNRLEQVLARREWQDAEHAEGLLLDTQDRVIEGVFSNLFWVREGVLETPSLHQCGVAGVMRAALLEAAASQGLAWREVEVGLEVLLAAQEVFMCNSLYGVWPVRRLAGRRWTPGELTRRMQRIARNHLEN